MIDYAKALNEAQYAAATCGDGPVLVVAGAGSGKTRTITYRLAWLAEQGVAPESMLLLTFTRKAAQEMLHRAGLLCDHALAGVQGGTFHAFAYGILRRFLAAIRPAKPNLTRGNVRDVLDATLRLLEPDLAQREIALARTMPKAVPEVFLDAQQLEQVFFNLIKNAMDAVSDGGRIGVTVTTDDAWVNVSVLDNGAGIPAPMLGRIFDPYVTTKEKGNGLGLMIVRRIVQAHGGTITCASHEGEGTYGGTITCASHEGEGTCFTVSLPRAERRVRALGEGRQEATR